MNNATNPTQEPAQPVYQVQAKPNGVWVDVDAEQYADYSKQLSRYQVRTLYTAPVTALAPAEALNELRARVKEMQEAAYTFGDYSKDAVDAALGGVLDVIDEMKAAPADLKTDAADEEEEEDPVSGWRRLALQFDGHRMQALHHLRAMTQDSAKHIEHAIAFLSAGPLPGEVVLAKRVASIACRGVVGKVFQALTDRGEMPLEELRCVLLQIKENSNEAFIVNYTDDAIAWLDVAETIGSAAMPGEQPGIVLTADECFVALSWSSVARSRINFGEADEGLLAKLGAVCPNAARNVEMPAEIGVESSMQLVAPEVVRDSDRWRAVVNSGRIRPQGCAGLNAPMANNYAHMGMEIWTTYDRDFSAEMLAKMDAETALGRDYLTKYADVAVAAHRAVAESGALVCTSCRRLLGNPQDPLSQDCGGHCLQCMADAGDPAAASAVLDIKKQD